MACYRVNFTFTIYFTSCPNVKLPRSQGDPSPVSDAEDEKVWSFVFTPMEVFGYVAQMDKRRNMLYVYPNG
jgi:hypothetical protein